MWHCPHCGAPQAETARCWVCRRSSTTCSTCRHFRASLAADVGYCALDHRRRPLTGTEQRGCWAERSVAVAAVVAAGRDPASVGTPTTPRQDQRRLPVREFVPVEAFIPIEAVETGPDPGPAPSFLPADATDAWEARTSLFGDAER